MRFLLTWHIFLLERTADLRHSICRTCCSNISHWACHMIIYFAEVSLQNSTRHFGISDTFDYGFIVLVFGSEHPVPNWEPNRRTRISSPNFVSLLSKSVLLPILQKHTSSLNKKYFFVPEYLFGWRNTLETSFDLICWRPPLFSFLVVICVSSCVGKRRRKIQKEN